MNRRGFLRALGLTAAAIPAAKVIGSESELVKQVKDNIKISKANGLIHRDDLSDIIYNISPQDTPFLSHAKMESMVSTEYRWK